MGMTLISFPFLLLDQIAEIWSFRTKRGASVYVEQACLISHFIMFLEIICSYFL